MSKKLRSHDSYGKQDKDGFIHRSWMKSLGLPDDVFDGRPVVGICNTWSELTPCNQGLRKLADHVKRGVWEAGGLPLEFPVMSLGETQMRPTAMLYRNLLSMDVEESIRGNPIDGVVLLGGCDKTTPGQLMGAASVDLPTLVVSSGPMLNGKHCGLNIGSGTDVWRYSDAVRAGTISREEFAELETGMSRSAGTCMTMGSASTFACIVEAMGLSLSMNATLPAVDSRRATMSHLTGRAIVSAIHADARLSSILTRSHFKNAVIMHAATGGSTNAIIHLLALAGRVGIELSLADFDEWGRKVPLLLNLQPSGTYLMEDFHYAGGVPALLSRLTEHLDLSAICVTGETLAKRFEDAKVFNDDVIRPLVDSVKDHSGAWVLKGNVAPGGAIIKPNAATKELLRHKGRAVVFESIEDYKARIDDPDLDVDETCVLVLKGCGPKGYPGMPEVGNFGLPKKLLEAGVRDMVRISDARMSGTAFGTVVLHVSPESSAGGCLALIRDGDIVELDGPNRRLQLHVSDAELQRRRQQQNQTPPNVPTRGYARLYVDHVQQAHLGADFDFLVGCSGASVDRESH